MKKRGHIIFAILINFLFIYSSLFFGFLKYENNWSTLLIISTVILFYSLFPDIDHKNSTITWWFLGIGIIGLVIGLILFFMDKGIKIIIYSIIFLIFTFFAVKFFSHRGFIHSILAGILAVIPLWFLFDNIVYCIIGFLTWYSHLFADGLWFKWK